jgi:hypothetical protein
MLQNIRAALAFAADYPWASVGVHELSNEAMLFNRFNCPPRKHSVASGVLARIGSALVDVLAVPIALDLD